MNDTDKKFFMYGVLTGVVKRIECLQPQPWQDVREDVRWILKEIDEIRRTLHALIDYQEIDSLYKNVQEITEFKVDSNGECLTKL